MTYAEHDTACQECDTDQQRVGSLEAELKREKASAELAVDLGREKAKVLFQDKELDEAIKSLEAEISEHNMLRATIGVVCDDLKVV
jgi:hypothetical protein